MKKWRPNYARFGIRILIAAACTGFLLSAAGKNPAVSVWLSEKLCTSMDIEALFSFFK